MLVVKISSHFVHCLSVSQWPLSFRSFSLSWSPFINCSSSCLQDWCSFQEVVSCDNVFKVIPNILFYHIQLYLVLCWCLWSTWSWLLFTVMNIYLLAEIQLHQNHLLQNDFFHCIVLSFFFFLSKSCFFRYLDFCVSLWFCFIDQPICFHANTILFYFHCSKVQFEIRDGDISQNSFTVQDYFSYPRFVVVVIPYESEYCSLKFCNELCWNSNGNCFEYVVCI